MREDQAERIIDLLAQAAGFLNEIADVICADARVPMPPPLHIDPDLPTSVRNTDRIENYY